jgi:protoporphyrinogen oxidase
MRAIRTSFPCSTRFPGSPNSKRATVRSSRARFSARANAKNAAKSPRTARQSFPLTKACRCCRTRWRHSLVTFVKLNTPVTKLTQTEGDGAYRRHPVKREHGAVIYCGTAPWRKLAELNVAIGWGGPYQHSQSLAISEIRYPPVASVVLGFRREDVAHPCQGYGMLIPKIEGFNILGTIFSSSLFPNRAPAGHLTLTSYVGGERQPELASLPGGRTGRNADLRGFARITGSKRPAGVRTYEALSQRRFRNTMSAMAATAN